MSCFYEDGLDFSCARCSHCCTTEPGYVYLSSEDLKLLLDFTKLPKDEFISQFCRWVGYYDGTEVLCLKEKKNYDCILWGEGGCTAYSARPVQCRTYPFWTNVLKSASSWNQEKSDCPGINCGKKHSYEEIKENLALYEQNKPISRGEL